MSAPLPDAPRRISTSPSEAEIIHLWLQQHGSENTRGAYARDVRKIRAFIGKPLDRLTAIDTARFAEHLSNIGLAPISRARTLAAVRSFLRFAQRSGVLAEDLADTIRLPRCNNRLAERILAEEQVQRMINGEADERNRTILSLLYTGGLRVSELCGLRHRHLQGRGLTG
ncbi:MAG: site-specific integrase, partial [Bryobacteraceae bacterium]